MPATPDHRPGPNGPTGATWTAVLARLDQDTATAAAGSWSRALAAGRAADAAHLEADAAQAAAEAAAVELAQLQAEGREEIAADDAAGRAMLEAARLAKECGGCTAGPGEECRPSCTGEAAHLEAAELEPAGPPRLPIEDVTPGTVVRVNVAAVMVARTVRTAGLVRLHTAAGGVIFGAAPGALVTVEATPADPGPCPSVPQILRAIDDADPIGAALLAVGYSADWQAVLVAAHPSLSPGNAAQTVDDAGRILTRAGWLVAADYRTHPASVRVTESARPGIRTAL